MKKSYLITLLSCLVVSTFANSKSNTISLPSDESINQIVDLNTCVEISIPYFEDSLSRVGEGNYMDINRNFTGVINSWLTQLESTRLNSSEKIECIQAAIEHSSNRG